MKSIKRTKVGQGYWQCGYGKNFKKSPIVYLINGKYYAKDKHNSELSFEHSGLDGYVMINKLDNKHLDYFYQVSVKSKHENA